jgi:hypothetical protein
MRRGLEALVDRCAEEGDLAACPILSALATEA